MVNDDDYSDFMTLMIISATDLGVSRWKVLR